MAGVWLSMLLGFVAMIAAPWVFLLVLLLSLIATLWVSLWVNPADWRKPRQRRQGIIHGLRAACSSARLRGLTVQCLIVLCKLLIGCTLPLSRLHHPQFYDLPARTVPPSWLLVTSLRLSGRLVGSLYRLITFLELKTAAPCKTPLLFTAYQRRGRVQ
ncbi:MAG: hypothetical protein PXX73_03810 [Sideroxydans sp.]|nr:hypothetical protein [Sideroxydans sp.]